MIHTCDLLFCRICLLLEYVSSAAGYHAVSVMSNNDHATCDFQQCGILKSVDLDEPVQPPFKLKISK